MTEVNPANAITLLYGISGVGKSRQIDEAAEYVYETYNKRTRVYVSDLGGWGNKRLSLIKLGIVQVWYFVNHVDPWATAELASLGWWPDTFIDAHTGLAAPDCTLISPRQTRWVVKCPQGHPVETLTTEPAAVWTQVCPHCGTVTTLGNCLGIDKQVIRSRGFADIGLYAYDSLTQTNEAGMEAAAERGAGMQEGEALRSPAALLEGRFTFGLNAKTHYGFLQQRSRGWLRNIRTIPDQIERAIVTCGVEMGKGDDESGGIPIYGPKIAGNARTSSVPGWAGNCLHLSKETLPDGTSRHRIWLVSHTDPRDPRAIPYLAKHRGEPEGMPSYLEDDPAQPAFTTCSLKTFYRLEKAQLAQLLEQDARRLKPAVGEAPEELISTLAASVSVPSPSPAVEAGARRRRMGGPIPSPTTTTLVPPPNPPDDGTVPASATTSGTVAGESSSGDESRSNTMAAGAVPRLRRLVRPPTTT